MTDGIAWIDDELGAWGFSLTMVKGISHDELAVYLGAQPGTGIDPDTAHGMLELSPGPEKLPDCAMLGTTSNGWAFAIESPAATDRADRLAPGRDMWSEQTVVSIWYSTMDPPIINVNIAGKHDWMFWEYSTDHTDHPLTRRLVAEAGLVLPSDDTDADEETDGDEESDEVAMADVYRIMGEHYGLTLPRQAVTDRRLPHFFTEPRVFVRPQTRCPVCGEQMLPHGGGSWEPSEYRLVCVYYKLRDIPGHPPHGCPGEISGPALAKAVHEEPNPKYRNIRMPRPTTPEPEPESTPEGPAESTT
ncbi:hypothetical protein [Streptomyces cadmiisoli]|uniref:hypothetical protein n=1 Tax=Streptomyces cadmiisoli TaxID=2184053 RepID=UPI00365BC4A5